MSVPHTIRLAQSEDLPHILALQKTESNRVGFLPSAALKEHIDEGRALVAVSRNGVRVAYLVGRRKLRDQPWVRPITQIVVLNGERRKGIATLLVLRWCTLAQADGQDIVQAWTREDLQANMMWPALGFVAICGKEPKTARGKSAILWRFPMTANGMAKITEAPARSGWKTAKTETQMIFQHAAPSPTANLPSVTAFHPSNDGVR